MEMPGTDIRNAVPEDFWTIIEAARQDPDRFREMLHGMDQEQIMRFYWTYEELANQLRTEQYFAHVHPDLSEDGMAELANWVVAQGAAYYRMILDHPDLIPPRKDDQGLLSEAVDEYEQRFNDDIPPNLHDWDNDWKQHGKSSPWA